MYHMKVLGTLCIATIFAAIFGYFMLEPAEKAPAKDYHPGQESPL